jgi:hypothetical protein
MFLLELDNYRIVTADKQNYSLEKYEETIDLKSKEPTGEFKWKGKGFYGKNLKHALNAYKDEVIMDLGKVTVDSVIDKLDELTRYIERKVKKENIQFVHKESMTNE